MTASFTLTGTGEYFPSGTTVAVYPRATMIPEHAPSGSSVTSAVAGSSSVAFTGLEYSTAYVAYALLGGVHKYKTFATDAAPTVVTGPPGPPGADTTPAGVFNVLSYGAVGDGVTDDTAAIQAAINAAKAVADRGGTVLFPITAGGSTYKTTAALNCNSCSGLKLEGVGGRKEFQASPTIQYTGASGNAITCLHTQGFTMEGLRVRASNAAYNGNLIDCGAVGGDTTQMQLRNCGFRSVGPAASLVRMDYVIISTIASCHFGGATIAIKCGDGSYCVAVSISEQCTFNSGAAAGDFAIVTREGAESIQIHNNTFEAQLGTYAGAWKHTGGVAWDISYRDNWHGDQANGTYPWVQIDNQINALEITSNKFVQPGKWVALGASALINGGVIMSNFIDSPNSIDLGPGNHANLYIFANYPSPTIVATGGTPHATYAETVDGRGYDLGVGFPHFGHGTVKPAYGVDVLPGSDHRALRLLDGGLYFGGTEGNQDSTRQIVPNVNGFYFAAGDAAGANLGLVLQETSVGSVGGNSAVLYIEDNGAGKTRLRIKWDNGSDTILATEP